MRFLLFLFCLVATLMLQAVVCATSPSLNEQGHPNHISITTFEDAPGLCSITWQRVKFYFEEPERDIPFELFDYRILLPVLVPEEMLHERGFLESEDGGIKIMYTWNRSRLSYFENEFYFGRGQSEKLRNRSFTAGKVPLEHRMFSRWGYYSAPTREDLAFVHALGELMGSGKLFERERIIPPKPKQTGPVTYKVLSPQEVSEHRARQPRVVK